MKQHSYLENSLQEWIKTNAHKFNYKPEIKKWNESSLEIFFKEAKSISIITGKNDISISAFYEDECIDLLASFELGEKRDKRGYICILCNEESYYDSRFSLYADHLFTPVSEWVNEFITPNHILCFYRGHDKKSEWAKILHNSKIESDQDFEYMFHKESVIKL